ncbi:MAG: hypothetical protein A2521_11625 [Deltaproteobacteria bacterium RIFOXYD12_FULL_57_12]|nr:MAG: hypothetical protein A2521_11625 [Deltaproteobacteria bacterium RIFOXYD12_FULL_57_12]
MQRFSICFLATVILVWTGTTSAAIDLKKFGRIINTEGQVTLVHHDGKRAAGAPNLPLQPGDRLITGENGVVRFLLDEGYFFTLFEKSAATIDELVLFDPEKSPALLLEAGHLQTEQAFRVNSIGLALPVIYTPGVIIQTKIATFDTVVSPDGTTAIAVKQGLIKIKRERDWLTLSGGENVVLGMDGQPDESALNLPGQNDTVRQWRKAQTAKLAAGLKRTLPQLHATFEQATTSLQEEIKHLTEVARSLDEPLTAQKNGLEQSRKYDQTLGRQMSVRQKTFDQRTGWFREKLNRVTVLAGLLPRLDQELTASGTAADNESRAQLKIELEFVKTKMPGLQKQTAAMIDVIRQIDARNRELAALQAKTESRYKAGLEVIKDK